MLQFYPSPFSRKNLSGGSVHLNFLAAPFSNPFSFLYSEMSIYYVISVLGYIFRRRVVAEVKKNIFIIKSRRIYDSANYDLKL